MPAEHSIARGIFRPIILGVGGLLMLFALGLSLLVEAQLRQISDAALTVQAQSLAANVEQELDQVEMDLPAGLMLHFEHTDKPDYFELRDLQGKLLARSPSMLGHRLPTRGVHQAIHFASITLPDGRFGRMVTTRFKPRLDTPDDDDEIGQTLFPPGFQAPMVALSLAVDDQPHLDLVRQMRWALAVTVSGLMIGIVWLVRISLARGLRPVADIRSQIARLDANRLESRISPREHCLEMQEIVDQINALLGRLHESFHHERRFAQDVAHELRTPLSELRSMAEVAARWPDEQILRERFFANALDVIAHMENTLGNLLALARSERGLEINDPSTFDLFDLTVHVRQALQARAGLKSINVQITGAHGCLVPQGRDQWLHILHNLIGNAIEYSAPGSTVQVNTHCTAHRFEWSIHNPTTHLGQDDLPRLFERLWRQDNSRASADHAGLGLSLVRAYAHQLSLDLQASLDEHDRLTISLAGQARLSESSASPQLTSSSAA